MNSPELIDTIDPMVAWATKPPQRCGTGRRRHRAALIGVTMVICAAVSGCITVNAPAKPIVIELNINIKQEVVYRLAADAGKTIQNNKDIF